MLTAFLAFLLGALMSLYTTPLMRRAALQFGIVDHPNNALKQHKEPVPYLGGLAVFLAFLITLGLLFDFTHEVLGILLASTLMLLVGLIDDLGALSPAEKLYGQLFAVAVLLKAGVFVKLLFLPTWVAFPISVLWLLTVTNALNIIDIMDGLAPGAAAMAAAFLAIAAALNDEPMVAVMSAALAGALVGFLRFNFAPARIYLGDAGSLSIGLTLGALAMSGSYTSRNPVALLAPVIILGVPLFDLVFVMVVRWIHGLSPFRGSPDHFALRLRRRGFGVRATVLWTYAAGAALGVAALFLMGIDDDRAALTLVTGIGMAALVIAFWLGREARA